MLDTQSKETLDIILSKDQASLSTEEEAFLLARRSYLNDEQLKRYASLIKAHEAAVKAGKKRGRNQAFPTMSTIWALSTSSILTSNVLMKKMKAKPATAVRRSAGKACTS